MPRAAAQATVALALVAGACGGDDDSSSVADPTAAPAGDRAEVPDGESELSGDDVDSDVDPGFAVLTIGDQSWEFNMKGPVAQCGEGRGTHGGLAGFAQLADAELVFNLYPSDHEFEGTQHNAIGVDAIGDDNDWTTAGPDVLEDAGDVPGLSDAVVEMWEASATAATATATFYRPSSLEEAKLDLGPLVTETGTFAVACG